MIHRIITITLLLVAGLFTNTVRAQITTKAKLTLTDAKIADARTPPLFLQVSWDLTGLEPGDRIINYRLTVNLSANGQEGEVVQTPRPELKTVMVALAGIPNDVRTKIFTGGQIVSAKIILRATILHRGARQEIFASLQKSFPTQGVSPKPRPTPGPGQVREVEKRVIRKPITR
jgi:hypothetical protein